VKHLLSVAELDGVEVARLLALTDRFVEVSGRAIPKVPALRGRTVATMFFETSTRTRLSFETAAKRLSADTMTFTATTSALAKGESLRDTVETLSAMGVDLVVVRHSSAGVPWQLTRWTDACVVNGGDGWHEHPTQGLLDAYTLLQARHGLAGDHPSLAGQRIGIVGDVKHSRVARSDVAAFTALGAEVTLIGPPTLMPPSLAGWPVAVGHDLDEVLPKLDVVVLLRLQAERMDEALLPSRREYTTRYGLTAERAARLAEDVVVMHPGPVNRGVELDSDVMDLPATVVTRQVENGVAVRMAVLYYLLGSGVDLAG
jgi:aspartate carbamoyltransferase catalytic subunit